MIPSIFSLSSIVFFTVPSGRNASAAAENSNVTIKVPGFTSELEIELSQVQPAKGSGLGEGGNEEDKMLHTPRFT